MPSKQVHLAIDLGAGSGRVVAASTNYVDKLYLEEIHRFDNPGTDLPGGSFWNIIGLYREVLHGLRLAVDKFGERIQSLGIDTWGCDFGLLDGEGRLLGLPHQYRDPRSDGMGEELETRMGLDKVYASTGVMTAFYNTSLHLLAEVKRDSPQLREARQLLFIPDLLSYWLAGTGKIERTIASTSQLLSPITHDWAWDVIDGLGLPHGIFGEVVSAGTILGSLRDEVAREIGASFPVPVIASASHDTASSVAGIPGEGPYAFISSGTWAIIGVEIPGPILSDAARIAGFANEQGVEDTTRFLCNISGLWLIQECKRQWAMEGADLDYDALAVLAAEAPPFTGFVDPDDAGFASPGDMPGKIQAYCKRTGQTVPRAKGNILRVATESIALKHQVRFEQLKELTGRSLDRIHMGGGGIQNELLVQAIANACGVPVHAGPVESTACGNLITQMVATGSLPNIAAGRALIRSSLPLKTFEPRDVADWSEQAARFQMLLD